jgi:hypothetical protein
VMPIRRRFSAENLPIFRSATMSKHLFFFIKKVARQHSRFVRDLEKSRQSDAGCAARPSRSAEARPRNVGQFGQECKVRADGFWEKASGCLSSNISAPTSPASLRSRRTRGQGSTTAGPTIDEARLV